MVERERVGYSATEHLGPVVARYKTEGLRAGAASLLVVDLTRHLVDGVADPGPWFAAFSAQAAACVDAAGTRYAGDMAVLGKGELFVSE